MKVTALVSLAISREDGRDFVFIQIPNVEFTIDDMNREELHKTDPEDIKIMLEDYLWERVHVWVDDIEEEVGL